MKNLQWAEIRNLIFFLRKYDVQGSIAHVKMLGEVGLMSKEEAESAVKGLEEILREIHNSKFTIEEGIEDVHSQVEFLLTKRLAKPEKKFIAAEAATTR